MRLFYVSYLLLGCLMSLGQGRWQHPFIQASTPAQRSTGTCCSSSAVGLPSRQPTWDTELPVRGSRLVWLPWLALLGAAAERRGVPCFAGERGSAVPAKRQGGGKNAGDNPAAPRKMQGGGKSQRDSPKLLTSKITKAGTAAKLLGVLDDAVDSAIFNDFHASAACTKLARWNLGPGDVKNPVLPRLIKCIQVLIQEGQVGPRALANVVWAFAKLSVAVPKVLEVVPVLVKAAASKANGMKAQELANSLWAAAQLQDTCPEVAEMVPALVAQIPGKAGEMIPQALSNSLWATAKLKGAISDILDIAPALVKEIPGKVDDMNPQELSNCLWATAKLQDAAPEVLSVVSALVEEIPGKTSDMKQQELSNILWAAANLHDKDADVLKVVGVVVEQMTQKPGAMNQQDLANNVWAAAQLQDAAPEVLQVVPALVAQIPAKAPQMIPQALSMSLWATAKLQDAAPEVLQVVPALVEEIPAKAPQMDPQALSTCLFAAMRLADAVPEVIEAVPALVKEVPGKIRFMKSQELSNSLEALVALGEHLHIAGLPGIVTAGGNCLKGILSEVRGKDFSFTVPTVLWACAKTETYDEELFGAVAERFPSQKRITSLLDWGVCAIALAYRALDQEGAFRDLLDRLESEISKRGLREEEVLATRG